MTTTATSLTRSFESLVRGVELTVGVNASSDGVTTYTITMRNEFSGEIVFVLSSAQWDELVRDLEDARVLAGAGLPLHPDAQAAQSFTRWRTIDGCPCGDVCDDCDWWDE